MFLELRLFGFGKDHSDGFDLLGDRWLFDSRYIRIPWRLGFGKISSDSLKVAGSSSVSYHLLGRVIFVMGWKSSLIFSICKEIRHFHVPGRAVPSL